MEEIKSLETLFEPDVRWKYFARYDPVTNSPKQLKIEDKYSAIEKIVLNDTVPEDVQSQFNVARMLCIYAWLYYPFNQIAELKAYSTLEMGLKARFPGQKNLKALLSLAVKNELIRDEGFSEIILNSNDPFEYSKKLPEIISYLRNDLAHGTTTLLPISVSTLKTCSEILNQLFPKHTDRS